MTVQVTELWARYRSGDRDFSGMDLSCLWIEGDPDFPYEEYGSPFHVEDACFNKVNFEESTISQIRFKNCQIRECEFVNVNFEEKVMFSCCDFTGSAIFSPTFKQRTIFLSCDFTQCKFYSLAQIPGFSANNCCIFHETDFSACNLWSVDLTGWRLDTAKIDPIWEDLFRLLCRSVEEIPELIAAIKEGKIDGGSYSEKWGDSSCRCINGTLAKSAIARNCSDVVEAIARERNPNRPIERFILNIFPGDTPQNHWKMKLLLEKTIEFQQRLTQCPK